MPTPCYLLAATDEAELFLRRYTESQGAWTCDEGWHDAMTAIGRAPIVLSDDGRYTVDPDADAYRGDSRWPPVCDRGCGYAFVEADRWQVFTKRVYRVTAAVPGAALEVGAETNLRDCPDGAMWFAHWVGEWTQGFDGRALVVRVPGRHDWQVDGQASNCTRPGDRTHRCWLRDGEPPYVTVGKTGGETCAAGGGSIMAGSYHGFLRGGILTDTT